MLNRDKVRNIVTNIKKSRVDFGLTIQSLGLNYDMSDNIKLLNRIQSDNNLGEKLNQIYRPSNYELLLNKQYYFDEKEEEFQLTHWLNALISHYSAFLNSFILAKTMYEKKIIIGEFNEAECILSEIEKLYGKSFWSLGQRMLVLENTIGYKANKEYLSSLISVSNRNNITLAKLHFYSYVAEKNMSYENYQDSYNDFVQPLENKILAKFISYSITLCKDDIEITNLMILQLSRQFPVIDIYEIYVDLIQRDKFDRGMFWILDKVYDKRLLNKYIVSEEVKHVYLSRYVDESLKYLELLELYSSSKYTDFLDSYKQYISINPDNFQLVILAIKASILTSTSFQSSYPIYKLLYKMYTELNSKEVLQELRYYQKLFNDFSWKYKIQSFIDRKTNFIHNEKIKKLSFFNDHSISPLILKVSNCIEINTFLYEVFKEICPLTIDYIFYGTKYSNGSSLDFIESEKRKLFVAELLLKERKYVQSITLLENLEQNLPLYRREKYVIIMYRNLLLLERFEDAIKLYVDSYFHSSSLVSRINSQELFDNIKRTNNELIKKNIITPIFIKILDFRDDMFLVLSISNFFQANDIIDKESFFNYFTINMMHSSKIFFLNNITTRYLLERDVTLVYDKKQSLDLRLDILKYLTIIDEHNTKRYSDEIVSLEKERSIEDRIQSINVSKITVDIDLIFDRYQEMFRETYGKLLDTLQFADNIVGIDISSKSFIESFNASVKKINDIIEKQSEEKHSYILLRNLTKRIVKELLFNPDYGLDRYISSRIRHGFAESQLTEIFLNYNLLSKTSNGDGEEFLYNLFWSEKFTILESARSEFILALSVFSKKIYNIISQLTKSLLKIKSIDNEEGVFDFTMFTSEFIYIYLIATEKPQSFDVFFNTLVAHFWLFLDKVLSYSRKYLSNLLYKGFITSLEALEADILAIEQKTNQKIISQMLIAIKYCRAGVRKKIDDFVMVLNKKDVQYKDFTFDELIETCLEINSRMYKDFDQIKVESESDQKFLFDGTLFPHFIDIYNILINNAITHSKLGGLKDLVISFYSYNLDIRATENQVLYQYFTDNGYDIKDKEFIILETSNNFSSKIDNTELNVKLKKLMLNLGNVTVLREYSRTEGGSGFYKINSILQTKFDSIYSLLLSFEDNQFSVTIVLEKKILKGDII